MKTFYYIYKKIKGKGRWGEIVREQGPGNMLVYIVWALDYRAKYATKPNMKTPQPLRPHMLQQLRILNT
jgi:hypothetical protein